MKDIGYLSTTDEDYAKAIGLAKNKEELLKVLNDYDELCQDAIELTLTLTPETWKEFQKGLRIERRGKFAGEEYAKKYMAIILPEKMVKVSMIAVQFHVPFGTAYNRMKEEHLL